MQKLGPWLYDIKLLIIYIKSGWDNLIICTSVFQFATKNIYLLLLNSYSSPTLNCISLFPRGSYNFCNVLYVQGGTLPSAFDNVFDTVISMIMDKLLTGHPDLLRHTGICMHCYFSSSPEKSKP